MKYIKQIIYYILTGIFIINCTDNKPKNSKSESNNWQVLFDGTSLAGWRAYNSETLPEGWSIVDNSMTFTREKANEKDYDYTKVATSYMDQSNLKILNYMLNGKFQLEVIVVYFITFKKGTRDFWTRLLSIKLLMI